MLQTQHTPIAKKTRSKIKASQTTKSTIINLDGSSSTTSAKTEIEILNVQINRRTTVNTESNSLTVDLNDSIDTNSFLNAYNFETNDFDSTSKSNLNSTYTVEEISDKLSSISIESDKGI